MSSRSKEVANSRDRGWDWLDQKAEERLGDLRSYINPRLYTYDNGWNSDTEERTDPWLVWDPDESSLKQENAPYEVQIARFLEDNGYFQGWSPFEETSGHEERFTLQRYFGSIPPHPDSEIPDTVVELCSRLELEMPDPDPVKVMPTLKVMRNESRKRLNGHAEELTNEVMRPLRKVLIPCAIEATKALTDSRPLHEVDDDVIEVWSETVQDLDHLWEFGIGNGISFEVIDEHENWYGRTFQHVPDPVADGAKTALKVYVGRSDEKGRDMSRDGILDRARPVFLKWEAARRIMWSVLYDWTLEEASQKGLGTAPPERSAPEVFKGKTRAPGKKGKEVHSDVREWAIDAWEHYYFDEGMSVEESKDKVLGIAERHEYHFARRTLERWINPNNF